MTSIESCFAGVKSEVRRILERSLLGHELAVADAITLDGARGRDLYALCMVADELRTQQCGERVSYVVNRNINFTNVCVKSCKFCAFSRELRSEQGYLLDHDEIVRRVLQAREYGATEVCLQAGLLPEAKGKLYVDVCRAVKKAAPELHIHAFSPEEIKYGAALARVSIRDFLLELKEAGLGSLPGTSAEILDDSVRNRISPGRITTAQWVEVISTAHKLGIRTTSTMMFGHVETPLERMRHLELLRSLQKETGGFSEFVPLSFVHADAPLFVEARVPGVSPGPTGDDVLRLYAIARLMLGAHIPNLQASWVKEGLRTAEWLLSCGVNDLGGTLMNESISTAAGAQHGQLTTPAALRRVIRDAGRIPVQRSTLYQVIREFSGDVNATDAAEPLDAVQDPDNLFGTYRALLSDTRFHYEFSQDKRRLALAE
jgi:7,8-didemethyl-8-hydroxy-5-deazariboflavin synthase CofH subunit